RRATRSRAASPTPSSSPAWPPASPRRSPTSSACAGRCPARRSSSAAGPARRRWPSSCPSPTASSWAPGSSATPSSPTPPPPRPPARPPRRGPRGRRARRPELMRAGPPPPAPPLVVTAAVTGACAALDASERPPASLPVAELLLVGFSGTAVADNEEVRRLVCDVKVGGGIPFGRDVGTGQPRQIRSAGEGKKATPHPPKRGRECAGRPLFIAADAEGGQVMRLSARLGYLPSLSPHELGMSGDVTLTELEARRIAVTLREAGINWNLAPVVDVAVNPLNPAVVAP